MELVQSQLLKIFINSERITKTKIHIKSRTIHASRNTTTKFLND